MGLMDAWQRSLERLEAEYPFEDVQTWLSPLHATERANQLVLLCPNSFTMNRIRAEYLPRIKELAKHFGSFEDVVLEIGSSSQDPILPSTSASTSVPHSAPKPAGLNSLFYPSATVQPDPAVASDFHGFLDKEYTFENFVQGSSNRMAHAAAMLVANNPGAKDHNPLLLYGGTGLGKTHLMFAAGNEMKRQNPRARILYLNSQQFMTTFVRSLQQKKQDEFKRQFAEIDALLLDDIQFLAGKDSTQEEFFHTFNALIGTNKQIILTCDRFPREVDGLESRLKSRLAWGLGVPVDPPDYETRAQIVMAKAQARNVQVSEEVAFLLAKRLHTNVRDLEGALNTLIAQANFTGRPITVDFAQETLRQLFRAQQQTLSIPNIIRVVADYYGVQQKDLLGSNRRATFVLPRHMAMALAQELTDSSLPAIGETFSGRDHTTVLHACRKMAEKRRTDGKLSEDWDKLIRKLSE